MNGMCGEKDSVGNECAREAGHTGRHMKAAPKVQGHHCHARGCTTPTKPEMLMCYKHWRMVPKPLQNRVWSTYRPGQCDDKRPSEAWHKAADDAIKAVWEKENAIRG